MAETVEQIALCIERGKVNASSPYPPDMKGEDGADELTAKALEEGVAPSDVLSQGLITGMGRIGKKFSNNEVFVPELLMAAKAMTAAMAHLKPFFDSGEAVHLGTFIVGTVQGDLHDIGKNLVAMVMEGGGWQVVDLGVDVSAEKFIGALEEHPEGVIGLSALLTTTMVNMEKLVSDVKARNASTRVIVGGAPLTEEFAKKIGADAYAPDPQGCLDYLAGVTA